MGVGELGGGGEEEWERGTTKGLRGKGVMDEAAR